MTKQGGLADRIGSKPTTALMFVYWLAQVIIGTAILLPTYVPEKGSPALFAGLGSLIAIKVYGLLLLIPGALGLYFLRKPRPYRNRMVEALTFWSFLLFTFFTLIRLVTIGPMQLVWVAYALCALTMGVVHLRLKWEND